MTSISSVELPQILAIYDFSQFERVADLGGGQGALLHGILSSHPKLRGILADLPHVVAGATILRSGAIADRCEIVGVDLFQSVPAGADGYVMKYIVHGFTDADALKILRNCRAYSRIDAPCTRSNPGFPVRTA
jgi:hypothetical protein